VTGYTLHVHAHVAYTQIGLNIGKISSTFMQNFSPVKATNTVLSYASQQDVLYYSYVGYGTY